MDFRKVNNLLLSKLLLFYYETQSGQMGEILSYISLAKSGVRKKGNRGIAAFQKLLRPSVRLSKV